MNLPLYHVSGLSILFRCLFFGACAVFSAPGALPSSITHASLVATQLYRFLDKGIRPPSTLRAVLAGGGPFPDSLLRRALRAGWPLHLTYGMTEAASQICTSQLLDPDVKEFFCGHPLPGRALRIAPDGEILLSGPVLFSHSLGSGNRFEPRRGNWYATGDLGEYEETKGLRIIGRRDRMFISGGENIHPEQIERALLEIPGVFGAIVLPVSDPEFGNRPIAFLQCSFSLDSPSDRERIVSHLRERIPSTHLPTDILPMPEFANGLKPSFKTLAEYLQNARTTF
jgi:O-succinylbenzoic acid--CoA ligase